MLKYEFFAPAVKGLKPGDMARVTSALEAAMLYGAIVYAEGRGDKTSPKEMQRRYDHLVSRLNTGEVFANV